MNRSGKQDRTPLKRWCPVRQQTGNLTDQFYAPISTYVSPDTATPAHRRCVKLRVACLARQRRSKAVGSDRQRPGVLLVYGEAAHDKVVAVI